MIVRVCWLVRSLIHREWFLDKHKSGYHKIIGTSPNSKSRRPMALFLQSPREPGELSQCSKYDVSSTINIIQVLLYYYIIIIMIIVSTEHDLRIQIDLSSWPSSLLPAAVAGVASSSISRINNTPARLCRTTLLINWQPCSQWRREGRHSPGDTFQGAAFQGR